MLPMLTSSQNGTTVVSVYINTMTTTFWTIINYVYRLQVTPIHSLNIYVFIQGGWGVILLREGGVNG